VTVFFGVFLLTLLLIVAIAIVRADNLFVAVMLGGIFSLLMATIFFLLDAPDVALTEAAVGAGISTVLYLAALALTAEREKRHTVHQIKALVVVTTTALLVIFATFDNVQFGDPTAPVHVHVGPWYLENTQRYMDIPNVVTAILGSFRGYDTLGELFVVFTAGIGVLFLLGTRPKKDTEAAETLIPQQSETSEGLRNYLIPRLTGRLLVPIILLFGLYVQFHGEYSPGGGFQAGAIIAAGIILYALLEGETAALRVVPQWMLMALMAGGALLYGMVGVVGMLLGGQFLDYSVLADNPVTGQQLGILLIELGVGMTVSGVLLSIFHAFAARDKY